MTVVMSRLSPAFRATVAAISAAVAIAGSAVNGQTRTPTIVLSGGGGVGPEIAGPVLQMAGGPEAVVAVLIHSKAGGDIALEYWKSAHPKEVVAVDVSQLAAAKRDLERATLLWFAGGVQADLMNAIRDTDLPAFVKQRYRAGIVVGGASAGAAVFTGLMTTGDADLTSMTAARTKTAPGLGLWPRVVLDQHVLKRQRMNRFVSLALDHPDLLGVAIDEGTAIVLKGRSATVLGSSNVVVIDARKADVPKLAPGQPSAGRNITMHVLHHGDSFDLGEFAPAP